MKITSKILIIIVLLVSLFFSIIHLSKNSITGGQIGKQTFSAEMAKSYKNNEMINGFPIRHFYEVFHPGPVAWAEEFPLYTYSVGKISAITNLDLIRVGRFFSFINYIFLIIIALRIGKTLKLNSWLFALPFALFPVFRIYGVSFMPDISMATFVLLAYYFLVKEKYTKSAIAIGVASLFKYYAVFSVLGIFMYFVFKREKIKFIIQKSFVYGLFQLPAFLYVVYFLINKIPNPITEYKDFLGGFHIASRESLMMAHTYIRWGTWIFVKNPSIVGSVLAFIGVFAVFYKKKYETSQALAFVMLFFSGIIFAFCFSTSFFVHDYYAIQISLATAAFVGFGLNYLSSFKFVSESAIVIFMISASMIFYSFLNPNLNYITSAKIIENNTQETDKLLIITDQSPPVLLFLANRSGAMMGMGHLEKLSKYMKKNIDEKVYDKVVITFSKKYPDQLETIKGYLAETKYPLNKAISQSDEQNNVLIISRDM